VKDEMTVEQNYTLSEGLQVTPRALSSFREQLTKDDTNPDGIRVGVRGGGCSGFLYNLEFIKLDDIDKEEDLQILADGVLFVVDIFSQEYLKGTTIDYITSLKESGFKFISNKPGQRQCGCGSSFSG
jgi:iron-sulfur cluster assembly accessory protein